jgi:hypothetical protein
VTMAFHNDDVGLERHNPIFNRLLSSHISLHHYPYRHDDGLALYVSRRLIGLDPRSSVFCCSQSPLKYSIPLW